MRVVAAALGCAVLLATGEARGAETIEVGVELRFESGSAILTTGSADALDRAAARVREALQRSASARLRIEGHTDGSGDADDNLRLSQERAEAVAAALVSRGIPADRVDPIGLGEVRPIADDGTDAGRRQNRRVELQVLGAAEATRTIATVARVHHKVARRAPRVSEWAPAVVKDPLFEAWRVGTEQRSAAEISFTQKQSDLYVRENTVVVIFGPGELMSTTTDGRLLGRASLEKGALKSRLAELAGGDVVADTGDRLEVRTAAAITGIERADVLVQADDGGKTRVAHHGGRPATVRSTKKNAAPAVSVAPGYGTVVVKNREPAKPTPLPKAPALEPGAAGGEFVAGKDGLATITARWQAPATLSGHHVELTRGGEPITAVDLSGPITSFEATGLPPGTYALTVSAIDAMGLEGPPSPPLTMTVVPPPVVATTTPGPAATTPAPGAKAPAPSTPPLPTAPPTTTPVVAVVPTTTAPHRVLHDDAGGAPGDATPTPAPVTTSVGGIHPLWGVLPLIVSGASLSTAAALSLDNEGGEHNGAITALAGVGVVTGIVGVAIVVEPLHER